MKIVLIGYMGSGKSSVGKKLAETLKIPFLDLDTEIERNQKKTISEIFDKKGEIHFRKLENTILKEVVCRSTSFVLATGGGTPCYGDSMMFLSSQKDVKTIYLKASLDILTARLEEEKEHRPLLAHLKTKEDFNDFIRKHLFERSFYYNQSNFIIDNNDTVAETLEKIILKLF